jgi:hypothetical protein
MLVLVLWDFVAMLKVVLELELLVVGSLEDSVIEVVGEKLGGLVLCTSLSIITSFPVIAFRSFICSLISTYIHQDLIQ